MSNALVKPKTLGPRRGLGLTAAGVLSLAMLVCLFATGRAPAQVHKKSDRIPSNTKVKAWTPPRTKWGDPDLQGTWKGFEKVPFERARGLGNREFFTDAEVAHMEAQARALQEKRNALIAAGKVTHLGFRGAPNYNAIFEYSGSNAPPRISKWTSAIIDPRNGRLPAWTIEQVKYWEAREAATKGRGETDSTEDMNLPTRCIDTVSEAEVTNWGMGIGPARSSATSEPDTSAPVVDIAGGPQVNASPGPVRRILQSPGYVAFVLGDKPSYRIVPLNESPHLDPKIREWMGDARGHWDGDTLVVDITNITFGRSLVIPNYDGSLYPGSGKTLHVVERFRLIDANTLEYRYTIDDPNVYVEPYTVRQVLRRSNSDAAETTVCQEDPKDLADALANARADEQSSLESGEESVQARQSRFEQLQREAVAAASRPRSNRVKTSTQMK